MHFTTLFFSILAATSSATFAAPTNSGSNQNIESGWAKITQGTPVEDKSVRDKFIYEPLPYGGCSLSCCWDFCCSGGPTLRVNDVPLYSTTTSAILLFVEQVKSNYTYYDCTLTVTCH